MAKLPPNSSINTGNILPVILVNPDTGNMYTVGDSTNTVTTGGSSTTILSSSTASPAYIRLEDGASTLLATVAQFHTGDNQSIPTANGVFTGGVAQILNQAGNLDRQRGTGFDNIPAVGVPVGTQQLAGPPFSTGVTATIIGATTQQNVTPGAMTNILVGDLIRLTDSGSAVEYFEVLAASTNTFGAIVKNNHNPTSSLSWFHYNQARDATIGDNVGGTGMGPSATYLYNQVSALFELDRSANGEKDGASGQGTAVAAEYEWNAGGPIAGASGSPSGLQFDRARNVQAKGFGAVAASMAAGATQTTTATTPSTLLPGMAVVIDPAGANPEGNYIGTGFTYGSNVIPFQNATQFAHSAATITWDQFSANGPGTSGFTGIGLGVEEEALWDPVSLKFYLERSATQDAVSGQNVVMESPALFNPAGTFDRWKGTAGAGQVIVASTNTNFNTIGTVVVGSGANTIGTVTLSGLSTVAVGSITQGFNTIGTVVAGSSANVIGAVTGTITMATKAVATTVVLNASGNGVSGVIAAPGAGQSAKIYAYTLVAGAAVTARWESPSGTAISSAMLLAANGALTPGTQIGSPILIGATAATVALNLSATVATSVGGHVAYYVE